MKPTDAEIAYFTHPDQAWLQELWEPAVGDRVMWGKCLTLVTFVPGAATTYLRVKILGERETSKKSEDLLWLPTLSDLLGMIEKHSLGYDFGKFEGGYSIRGYAPHEDVADWELVAEGSSLWAAEIAAAELLKEVKVAGVPSD